MSDFLHFLCWFACVFISAFCVAELTGEYWHFQSPAMSLLLPLCLSFMLGSFLFLGILKLRWDGARMQALCKATRSRGFKRQIALPLGMHIFVLHGLHSTKKRRAYECNSPAHRVAES